uniref:cytadherence high molecular weight protein 2-like n=1 Tax=Styela clava TaxID=7725 RepID=UPI0019396380|nr:cytadherence high molecular weight protein 2-like [Styela clava]
MKNKKRNSASRNKRYTKIFFVITDGHFRKRFTKHRTRAEVRKNELPPSKWQNLSSRYPLATIPRPTDERPDPTRKLKKIGELVKLPSKSKKFKKHETGRKGKLKKLSKKKDLDQARPSIPRKTLQKVGSTASNDAPPSCKDVHISLPDYEHMPILPNASRVTDAGRHLNIFQIITIVNMIFSLLSSVILISFLESSREDILENNKDISKMKINMERFQRDLYRDVYKRTNPLKSQLSVIEEDMLLIAANLTNSSMFNIEALRFDTAKKLNLMENNMLEVEQNLKKSNQNLNNLLGGVQSEIGEVKLGVRNLSSNSLRFENQLKDIEIEQESNKMNITVLVDTIQHKIERLDRNVTMYEKSFQIELSEVDEKVEKLENFQLQETNKTNILLRDAEEQQKMVDLALSKLETTETSLLNLKTEIIDLSQSLFMNTNNLSSLSNDVERFRNDLEQKLENLTVLSEIPVLNSELRRIKRDLQDETTKVNENNKSHGQQLDLIMENIHEINTSVVKLDKETKNLLTMLSFNDKKVDNVLAANKVINASINGVTAEMKSRNDTISNLTEWFDQNNNRDKYMRDEFARLQNESEYFNIRIQDIEAIIDSKARLKELKSLREKRKRMEKWRNLEKRYQNITNSTTSSLNKEHKNLRNEGVVLYSEKSLEELENALAKLTSDIDKINNNYSRLSENTSKCEILFENVQNWKEVTMNNKDNIVEIKKSMENFKNSENIVDQCMERFSSDYSERFEEFNKKLMSVKKFENLHKNELKNFTSIINSQAQNIEELQNKLQECTSHTENSIGDMNIKIQNVNNHLQDFEHSINDSLSRAVTKIQNMESLQMSSKKKWTEIENQITSMQNQDQQNETSQLINDVKLLDDKVEDLTAEAEKVQSAFKDLILDYRDIRNMSHLLEVELKKNKNNVENHTRTFTDVNRRIASLEENQIPNATLEKLKAAINNSRKDCEAKIIDAINMLEKDIFSSSEKVQSEIINIKRELNSLVTNLNTDNDQTIMTMTEEHLKIEKYLTQVNGSLDAMQLDVNGIKNDLETFQNIRRELDTLDNKIKVLSTKLNNVTSKLQRMQFDINSEETYTTNINENSFRELNETCSNLMNEIDSIKKNFKEDRTYDELFSSLETLSIDLAKTN